MRIYATYKHKMEKRIFRYRWISIPLYIFTSLFIVTATNSDIEVIRNENESSFHFVPHLSTVVLWIMFLLILLDVIRKKSNSRLLARACEESSRQFVGFGKDGVTIGYEDVVSATYIWPVVQYKLEKKSLVLRVNGSVFDIDLTLCSESEIEEVRSYSNMHRPAGPAKPPPW
jgi:hypothetical protein